MLKYREATQKDVDLYFNWANDKEVRNNSFNQSKIKYEDHLLWFRRKIESENTRMYVFSDNSNNNIGQVRIEKEEETIIGISIDANHRGKSYGIIMLNLALSDFKQYASDNIIYSYIKIENQTSYNIFLKVGFTECQTLEINCIACFKLIYKYD